ncbi:hypothetical protein [Deinococcus navajonensis]|uniref:Uncharacterized protein n=1 Tax=Deinococcus navajonensis TaxID=309884 RepID=A0ABV8XNL9_9DEIO
MKLKTLIRVAQAIRTPEPTDEAADDRTRTAVRGVAEGLRRDARVQQVAGGLRERARDLRSVAAARADQHLERLIQDTHARRGAQAPEEVAALLEARRREREAQVQAGEARRALLARAGSAEQRRVLGLVVRHTPWAGGTEMGELRYTAVLDLLAPSGHAAEEMSVHRALWTLAEARVLAISPHGVVSACAPARPCGALQLPAPGEPHA